MQKYVFRKYENEYPRLFKKEKRTLQKVCGPKATIEHVGSTAVKGLGGKGIIDIAVGVPKNNLEEYSNKLQNAHYELRQEASTDERLFFRKDDANRRIHLHLTVFGSRDWTEMTAFRDYLTLHPEEAGKYSDLKKKAALVAKGNGKAYRKYKEKFITRLTRKAIGEKKPKT